MSEANKAAPEHSVSDYYSAAQLRADRWSALREATELLVAKGADGRAGERLVAEAYRLFDALSPIEAYWAFPGPAAFDHLRRLLDHRNLEDLEFSVRRVARALTSGAYRRRTVPLGRDDAESEEIDDDLSLEARALGKPYFEVLIVDRMTDQQQRWLRTSLQRMRRDEDQFIYEPVIVPSLEDALIAILFNHNIQAVVVRPGLTLKSRITLPILTRYLGSVSGDDEVDSLAPGEYGPELCRLIARIRPELDAYLITDRSAEDIAGRDLGRCRRVFYNQEDFLELHLNILRGVNAALQDAVLHRAQGILQAAHRRLPRHADQPRQVDHPQPLDPGHGRLLRPQHLPRRDLRHLRAASTACSSRAARSRRRRRPPSRAFGSKQTFFATNGTSTCNKIVVQALVQPGDIVLVDRDCHKSHHYGMVLSGANVVYLDSYPLHEYSMYGAVPLREIKHALLTLKAAGKLDRVRMLLLTNCTFDGMVYDVERVMQECLAIKPDLIFLWDEAWFAFARFAPTYRQRTAMNAANVLREQLRTPEHAKAYEKQQAKLEGADEETLLKTRLIPTPRRASGSMPRNRPTRR